MTFCMQKETLKKLCNIKIKNFYVNICIICSKKNVKLIVIHNMGEMFVRVIILIKRGYRKERKQLHLTASISHHFQNISKNKAVQ